MPSFGNVSTLTHGTGLSLNHGLPAVVNAGDVIILWSGCSNPSNPPTAFTWPDGFTEGRAVVTSDEDGDPLGLAGWAWKRADGSEGGTTIQVVRNGSGGTSSQIMAGSFTIVDPRASGDPHDAETANNPDPSVATADFTPIDTTVDASLVVAGTVRGGINGNNYALAVDGFTAISSNSSAAGIDGGADWDYKLIATAGTVDPTSPTFTLTDDDGWASFLISFPPDGGGGTPQHLAAVGTITFDGSAIAAVEKHLSAVATIALAAQAAARVPKHLASNGTMAAVGSASLQVQKKLAATGTIVFEGSARLTVGIVATIRRLRTLLRVGT